MSLPAYDSLGFRAGQRVQAHPATDAWMMGDRYGVILKAQRNGVMRVRMDKSHAVRRFRPEDLMEIT